MLLVLGMLLLLILFFALFGALVRFAQRVIVRDEPPAAVARGPVDRLS
jgi:hypothetical protein